MALTQSSERHQAPTKLFQLTHYVSTSPRPHVWIMVPFITNDLEDPTAYYFGFEWRLRCLSKNEIDERAAAGLLREIKPPRRITLEQRLRLTSNGGLWLASLSDPQTDTNRVRLR